MGRVFVGCAGWNIPRQSAGYFPSQGTHLERYAARFAAVEINSSFYRPHQTKTYARWAHCVPPEFRFSVKIPKKITHEQRLKVDGEVLEPFLAEVAGLGSKLGCLLVQLPPGLQYDAGIAENFFTALRGRTTAAIACEPRHATWFSAEANELLRQHQIARVAADPACVPLAAEPGGWEQSVYYRLHGSPRVYYSAYDDELLHDLATRISSNQAEQVWCIFDNTALGAATENARSLLATL